MLAEIYIKDRISCQDLDLITSVILSKAQSKTQYSARRIRCCMLLSGNDPGEVKTQFFRIGIEYAGLKVSDQIFNCAPKKSCVIALARLKIPEFSLT